MALTPKRLRLQLLVFLAGTTALPGILLAREGEPNPEIQPPPPSVAECPDAQPVVTWLATQDTSVDLGVWDCGTWSHAYGVNADGDRIVGSSVRAATGMQTGFYLDDGGTMQPLPFLTGGTAVDVRAISADGGTIGGGANSATGWQAVIWSPGDTELTDIGSLGGSYSFVYGLNANGSVAVGMSNNQAFRWSGGTMTGLGWLEDHVSSLALGVSADGNAIIGTSMAGDGGAGTRAVRWMWGNGGAQSLGVLDGGNYSEGWAVSADGTVFVGDSQATDGMRAFRWTEDDGMESLGVLDGASTSHARAVNADGSVVVGWSDSQAMRWQDGLGMEAIPFLEGGTWSYALGVSADGKVVVGASDSSEGVRAFAWNALLREEPGEDPGEDPGEEPPTEPPTMAPIDILNSGDSIRHTAQTLGAATSHFSRRIESQVNDELDIEGPGGSAGRPSLSTQGAMAPTRRIAMRLGGSLRYTGNVATSTGADLAVATDLGGGFTLGAYLDLSRQTDTRDALSLAGTHLVGGTWLRYRQNPDRTGLTWRVAASAGGGQFDVTRLDLLPNTERGNGRTRMNASAMSAEIGYGFELAGGVAVSFARLTAMQATRSAYDETNAIGFPLSFDTYRESALVLTLGTDIRLDLTDRSSIELGIGLSHDLRRTVGNISGTSTIPGFTDFAIAGPAVVNRTRGQVSVGYVHGLANGAAVRADLSAAQSPWSNSVGLGSRISYEMRF